MKVINVDSLASLPKNTGSDGSYPPKIQSSTPSSDVRLTALQKHCLGENPAWPSVPAAWALALAAAPYTKRVRNKDPQETRDLVPALRESRMYLRTPLMSVHENQFGIFMRLPSIPCKQTVRAEYYWRQGVLEQEGSLQMV